MSDFNTILSGLSGRFIAFEGADGSGKSTQLRRFVDAARAAGVAVCEVREPGGTPIGEEIRRILLHTKDEMSLRCEMLLYMASRAQLVDTRIRPAIAAGELVIADRFVSSTIAYQGAAGGLPLGEINAVAQAATSGCMPELVLIFDVDQSTAARRTRGVETTSKRRGPAVKGAATTTLFDDRIERRDSDFHARVREGYLAQAKADPARHLVIDASGEPDRVWQLLQAAIVGWQGLR
ncbi:MAG: dTMP kinase [Planctomycetota bacterium]